MGALTRSRVLVVILAGIGCEADRTRAGFSEPLELPNVVGSYVASTLRVERPGSVTNLLRAPDTRLNLQLLPDGTTRGQLKITSDPEFTTKQALVGQWHLSPGRVLKLDLTAETFLEEIEFQVRPDGLAGEWIGVSARILVELRKVA